MSDSQAKAQEFLGNWTLLYTPGATYEAKIKFTRVEPDHIVSGRWNAVGVDSLGLTAHAWWDPHYQLYIIGVNPSAFTGGPNIPTTYSEYFVFRSIGSDGTVQGRYTKSPNSFYTSPYQMTGKKTGL
ncbi:hypothetical protein WDJ50_18300 (plasmid) [Deinococcus sp. VB142]|uniref:DUF1579 domain-containing protein n=1 Tax=Deinococcus sp. VB142 TaxID=3112952 RepID=A0AAU6Q987_9DEIO